MNIVTVSFQRHKEKQALESLKIVHNFNKKNQPFQVGIFVFVCYFGEENLD